MSQKSLSYLLKVIDALAILTCLVIACAVIPDVEARGTLPRGAAIAFVIGIVPLVCLGVRAWRLFAAIGEGDVFTHQNAVNLRSMGHMGVADIVVWLAELIAYVATQDTLVFSVTASISVAIVFAVSVSVVSLALSFLTERAATIKDENDLVV